MGGALRRRARSHTSGPSLQFQKSPTLVRRKPSLQHATLRTQITWCMAAGPLIASEASWRSKTCTGLGELACLPLLWVLTRLALSWAQIICRIPAIQFCMARSVQFRRSSLNSPRPMNAEWVSLAVRFGILCTTLRSTFGVAAQDLGIERGLR